MNQARLLRRLSRFARFLLFRTSRGGDEPARLRGAPVMPTNPMGMLCFVMGLLLAFAILTPFLEQPLG